MIGCNLAIASSLIPFLFQFGIYIVQTDFIQLIYGNSDIDNLIRFTDNLGNTGKNLAVIDFNAHTDVETAEYSIDNLHQFDFVQQGITSHHVCITLIELAITPFLRTVGTPYRLF